MSAKHGLARAFRIRGRVIGCCMMLALALSALVIAPAAANAEQNVYLSLGDSISYGYTQEKFNVNYPNEAPAFFEEGPSNQALKFLNGKAELNKTAVLVNTACPGETSEGLIGENPALGGEASTEPNGGREIAPGVFAQGEKDWHPCAYRSLNGLPLHTSLGNASQLEEALSILKEGAPVHPVKLISLNIGANDELAAIAECKVEVQHEWETEGKSKYGGTTPEESVVDCIGYNATHRVIPKMLNNIGHILGAIDSTSAGGGHYAHAIVLEGFYNPDSFVLPGSDALQAGVNQSIEEHVVPLFPNVTYQNPFPVVNKDAFNEGNATKEAIEQAAICKYTEMCNPNVQVPGGKPAGKDGDIHPSLAGAKQLGKEINAKYLANPAK